MNVSPINELISDKITGEWGKEPNSSSVKVIRTTNFRNDGKLDLTSVVEREIAEKIVQKKRLQKGDIIIEKSGGSPAQPVGRVVYFDIDNGETYLCNNFTSILRPSVNVNSKYLFFALYYLHLLKKTLKYQNKTTGIINLQLDRYINTEKVNAPSVDEQLKIVSYLDQADSLRQKRKQAIDLLDEYLKSVFLEMFGDPVTNSKGWEEVPLGDISDIVSGVTKGRKFNGKKTVMVPYMRVANVQDGFINLSEIKEIEVLPSDVEKYRLKNEDLLLTEGGDPDKLGRGGIWKGEIEECIHQNHIFRLRFDNKLNSSEYISRLIGSERGKRYFLKSAKQTTGIATINMTQLRGFPVLLTPIELQNKFAKIVKDTIALKQKMSEQWYELDNQFNALMQKHFNSN